MNKAIFLGNICNDLELKESGETKILNFNIAVQRKFKNKEGQFETDFFRITAFNNNATFIKNYFSKGRKILVECRVQNRNYEDEQGQKHYSTDFILENCYFADSKKNNEMSETTTNDITNTFGTQNTTVVDNSDLPF